jgi:hypothetical protein
MKLTDDKIIAAADDWKAWGAQFGWTCRAIGDTTHDERHLASFYRAEDGIDSRFFEITAKVRADIDKRLTAPLAETT